ncbi:MAG: deoxyguanosinetriphosphate triphosphohydrolase [Thermus sp.]|uniref:deoxyguanosinetriphosphate triphosphohydrolase n=1 Tax=Thermus sp. TaxID=275 RepID=UPI0033239143
MKFYREDLLRLEALRLAPYAVRASRGRAYPEEESPYRTPFQKDRDRVLHTTAFRRLEYKTQVFLNYEGDYYRTRLTHTLEVAQVARSIARALGLNEDLTETIALAHDLGHPPFGHSGEAVLNALMQDHGGFEHNAQALRIVTHLEVRYPGFRGLNLTYETLEGIATHEPAYRPPSALVLGEGQGSLEAQVVDLADEIAYTAHDLDDGLRSGLLLPESLEEVELTREVSRALGLDLHRLEEFGRRVLIRELLGLLITDAIEATHAALEKAQVESPEAVRKHPKRMAALSEGVREKQKELRAFLYKRFYNHPYILRQRRKAEHVLEKLFAVYTTSPEVLPYPVQKSVEEEGLYRAVCDYIAGMTDRFALEEYARLFDPQTR